MTTKQRVLITGGSGTVGKAFIEKYQDKYDFYSYARNEKMQTSLKRQYENVEIIIGAIEDRITLFRAVETTKPDIIIHAAAIKHIETGEKDPIQTCKVNILGSLNVVEAALRYNIPKTIAISTDKACDPRGVYGYTKRLTEEMFLQAATAACKFAVCRFGNVTHSSGSVLPFWLNLANNSKPLPLTHPDCNRFMFSRKTAAKLIFKSLTLLEKTNTSFLISQKMKTVNMLDLAKTIQDDVFIVGLRGETEKLNEVMISEDELPFTYLTGDGYILLKKEKNPNEETQLAKELSTATAERMTRAELLLLIRDVDEIEASYGMY